MAFERIIEYGGYHVETLADSTVKVYDKDVARRAMTILRQLATKLGVSQFNSKGAVHNTRQLGARAIKAEKQVVA